MADAEDAAVAVVLSAAASAVTVAPAVAAVDEAASEAGRARAVLLLPLPPEASHKPLDSSFPRASLTPPYL